MKKTLRDGMIVALAAGLVCSGSVLACEHVDRDGADMALRGDYPATYTEEGYSGDYVCSVCGELYEQGWPLPTLEPTEAPETPVPEEEPTPSPTPEDTPTPSPTPEPPATPTPSPVPVPTPPPDTPVNGAGNNGESVTSEIPVPPTGIPDPAATPTPETVPEPEVTPTGAPADTPEPETPRPGRHLFPVFSEAFPWRRLRMNPPADLSPAPAAGTLLWPLPEESGSPLLRFGGK